MRLIELQIMAFGQFKNRRFSFEPGLSIVYGENEQGKSTLLACLKVMFFGFTGRGRAIRENERLRFQPWDGSRLAANLVFEHQGVRYRLERSFGKTKAADKCVLMNDITGRTIDLPSQQDVGPVLFQVTAEEFTNTVFIGQLQSPIDNPDHSTLGKLANLSGSLDEGLSHQALDSQLQKAQVKLRADRGSGGFIPELQRQIEQYETLRQTAISSESAQQERVYHLDELKQQTASWDSTLAIARGKLARIRLKDKSENLERLKQRHQILQQQEATWQSQREALRFDGRITGQTDIDNLRVQLQEARTLQTALDNKRRIIGEQETIRGGEEALVRGFDRLQSFDRPMLDQLSNRIEAVRIQMDRLKQAEQLAALTQRVQQSRSTLHEQEQAQQAIEQEIQEHSQTTNGAGREQVKKFSTGLVLLLILAVILTIGGLIAGFAVRPILFAGSALGLILLAATLFTAGRNRMARETANRLAEEVKLGEIKVLQSRLAAARDQTVTARLTTEQDNRQLDLRRAELGPETASLAFRVADLEQLQAESNQLKATLEAILLRSGCTTLLELHISLNEADHARLALLKRDDVLSCEQVDELHLTAQAAAAWNQLAQSLKPDRDKSGKTSVSELFVPTQAAEHQAIEQQIDSLSRQVFAMESQARELRQLRASLEETIGNQNWDDYVQTIETEIKAAETEIQAGETETKAASSLNPVDQLAADRTTETPASLEAEIIELSRQVNDWRLEASSLESAVRHSPRTPLMAAEYDDLIRQTREKMQSAQDYYDSLILAREMFQAAYDEMQATFGPVLNEKTAETLRQLTGTRYQNIKIDRSFEVRVEAPEDGRFHEWDYFSGGTVDQIYLALRLAISDLVQASDAHLPLLLDDIFVQYDDERTAAGLKFLYAKVEADQIQALLLTSHSRIKAMAGTISPAITVQSL
jgi:exonuclease SbcC